MIADYCFNWPSHIVANTDKDFIESRAYSICDIHYSFKGSELFIISNVQALNIPYSFTVLTRYSLFPFHPRKIRYQLCKGRLDFGETGEQTQKFFCKKTVFTDVTFFNVTWTIVGVLQDASTYGQR